MTTLEVSGIILTVEFALIACSVLLVMLLRSHTEVKKDHADAGALLERVENTEQSRREALSFVFEDTYNLEGEELESTVSEYLEREKAFYSAMLNIYLQRKGEKLHNLPEELTKVLAPLVHLTPQNMVDADMLGSLETEKAALATELDETKSTLNQLMDEYNAAFDHAQAAKAQSAQGAAPPVAESIDPPQPAQSEDEPEAELDFDLDSSDIEGSMFDEPAPSQPPADEPDISAEMFESDAFSSAEDDLDIEAILTSAGAEPPLSSADAAEPPADEARAPESDPDLGDDLEQSFEIDDGFEVELDPGIDDNPPAATEAERNTPDEQDELSDLFEMPADEDEENAKKP